MRRQEQMSSEQQLRDETQIDSSSNGDPSADDNVAQIHHINAETLALDESGNEVNSSPKEETSVNKEKEFEKKLASEVGNYLEIMKESSFKICLDIIEGCNAGHSDNIRDWQSQHGAYHDSQGVVIVITNFFIDNSHIYPSLDASIGSELLRRVKFCLEDPRRQSNDNIKFQSVSCQSVQDVSIAA